MNRKSNRIPSPFNERITISGYMAAPDDFGRIRLIIVDQTPENKIDRSAHILRTKVPKLGIKYNVPYKLVETTTQTDDTRGVVTFTIPDHRKEYWLAESTGYRGRWVTIEATKRPYRLLNSHGMALDISLISA